MEKKIAQATQVTVKISEFLLVYKKKREREKILTGKKDISVQKMRIEKFDC